ncbi:MAG TPA: sigma-70 family RNA polymerase sigma factor [Blastocatellia bacterium]|nr:sigma-70 family RNA polymerase sigma factor [Blastocatellia bacterium]
MPETTDITADEPEVISDDMARVLVENHRRFLAFLERRVQSREVAEDILQEAFVRGLPRLSSLRQQESVVAWFYRMLRNALIDHYRRRDAEARAMQQVAVEFNEAAPDSEMMNAVCECVTSLISTLKPEYAAAIQRVDLDGLAVRTFAEEQGINPNNAGVRVHRAREALRRRLVRSCGSCATHGCLDCDCRPDSDSAHKDCGVQH